MRLLREQDVPSSSRAHVFRYSPVRALLALAMFVTVAAGFLVAGRLEMGAPGYVIGALVLLMSLAMRRTITSRFAATNWLVRVCDGDMYVKFRSYLNHHFDGDDPTVVHLALSELRAATIVREQRITPSSSSGRQTMQWRTLLLLDVRTDVGELAAALAKERARKGPREARWYGSSSAAYRHYPVRVPSPGQIEIEWAVVPKVDVLAELLERHVHVTREKRVSDFTGLGTLDRAEQESRLLALVQSGQEMDAIKVARNLYGYDHGQARRFIDELSGPPPAA